MSLGYLMFLLVLSLIDGTPGGAFIVFPVTAILSACYLFFGEEKALERRFAEIYVSYRGRDGKVTLNEYKVLIDVSSLLG